MVDGRAPRTLQAGDDEMKHRTTRRALSLGAAIALALALGACKGGDQGTPTPAAPAKVAGAAPAPAGTPAAAAVPAVADTKAAPAAPTVAAVPTPPQAPTAPTPPTAAPDTAGIAVPPTAPVDVAAAGLPGGMQPPPFDPATGRPMQRDAVPQAAPPDGVDAIKDFEGARIGLLHTANRVGEFDPCG